MSDDASYYLVEIRVEVDPKRLPDRDNVSEAVMARFDLGGTDDGILDSVAGETTPQHALA